MRQSYTMSEEGKKKVNNFSYISMIVFSFKNWKITFACWKKLSIFYVPPQYYLMFYKQLITSTSKFYWKIYLSKGIHRSPRSH